MDSNFKFRLQKVLDIRANLEEKSKIEFKHAMSEKDETEVRLKELKSNYSKFNSFNKEESIIDKKMKLSYLKHMNQCIDNTSQELVRKDSVVEEKRNILKQKQMERKTVEILKDKQETFFIKEQNLIEQKSNDEFALYSYIRRNNERR